MAIYEAWFWFVAARHVQQQILNFSGKERDGYEVEIKASLHQSCTTPIQGKFFPNQFSFSSFSFFFFSGDAVLTPADMTCTPRGLWRLSNSQQCHTFATRVNILVFHMGRI
jgi:hypothetical protein